MENESSFKTRLIQIAVVVLMVFLVWYFWPAKKGGTHGAAPVVVQTAAVQKQDMPIYLDGLGTIQAYNTVTVHTQVAGTLEKVAFREGEDVRKGDLLAQIDDRTFRANYDQAVATRDKDAANLENALVDLQRYENLGDDVSRQILDTQRALVKQLESTVQADDASAENMKAQLSYTHITAPFSGRTGIRQVDEGNLVQPGDTNGIVVLTQLQPISVIFSLPQQNLEQINEAIHTAGKLKVVALAQDGKTVIDTGVLELVDNQIDQTTGTAKLKATFPNKAEVLWPGGFTNARLFVSTQPGALIIPSVAVQRGPQGTYVFVLQENKTVKLQPVTVGVVEGDTSVITDGLQEGQQVVTEGMVKLQDGSKVALPGDQKSDAKPGDAKPADGDKKPDGDVKEHPHKDKAAQDKNS